MQSNCLYNEEPYFSEISISRFNDNGEIIDRIIIPPDNISNMTIMNDMIEPLPQLILSLEDPEERIIPNYPQDGRSVINVYIEYIQESKTIIHNFIINDIDILERSAKSTVYQIKASSDILSKLQALVNYSTKNVAKEPTKIIEELFKKTKIPFKFNSSLKHSDRKINYTTPLNYSLLDNINYLLNLSITENSGIYVLSFNIQENQFELISLQQLYSNGIPKNFNALNIPTSSAFSEMSEALALDIKNFNFIKGINLYKCASSVIANNFDYINRKWSKDVYDYRKITKIISLSNPNENTQREDILKKIPSILTTSNSVFSIDKPPKSYNLINNNFRDIVKFIDVLQFDCFGYIERDVASLFLIGISAKVPQYDKFCGTWTVSRIYHIFTKGKYRQNISLIRTQKIQTGQNANG